MPKVAPPTSPPPDIAPSPPDAKRDRASPPPKPTTEITPVDDKIGEGPGNLRDRADAFKRRRGTTS